MFNHPRTGKLVENAPILEFQNLSVTAQYAMIHYMAIDGEAWKLYDEPFGRKEILLYIQNNIENYIYDYAKVPFGYTTVKWSDLLDAVNGDQVLIEQNRKYDYSYWSPSEYEVPTWPVILSNYEDETLQDGWHRFTAYCKLQIDVPVLFYPQ